MVTKVEKSCEMTAGLNPKRSYKRQISRKAPNRGIINDYPDREYTQACGSGMRPTQRAKI